MSTLATSDAMFAVHDALIEAWRVNLPLSLDDMRAAAETLRQAAVEVRIMEEALDRRVAAAPAPVLRVIDGGRE